MTSTAAHPSRLVAAPVDPPALVGSTGSTTLLLVVVLLALGAAMIALAVWLVRATRSDPVALGPLEVMGDRHWRRSDLDGRRSTLERARPEGAPPPAPIVPLEPEAEPEPDAEREDVEDGAHPDEPTASTRGRGVRGLNGPSGRRVTQLVPGAVAGRG